MTSAILTARDEYLAALAAAPELVGIQTYSHGGTFTLKELEVYAKQAPALVLAALQFSPQLEDGVVVAEVSWGLIAFTKSVPATPKDRSALALIDAATRVVIRTVAGTTVTQVSKPYGMRARNLFGRDADSIGVAIWALEWMQTVYLVDDDASATLSDVHLVYDLAPRDNAAALGAIPEATDIVDPSV